MSTQTNDLPFANTDSENSVIVALDHGLSLGSLDGFKHPESTLETVLAGNPDGVLIGPHFARRFENMIRETNTNILITADSVTFSTKPGLDEGADIWTDVVDEDLIRSIDPMGVKVMLVFGRQDTNLFAENISYISKLANQLHDTGIPLIVEAVMWGPTIPEQFENEPEYIENACRMAWEFGADALKIPYTGDMESFSSITSQSPVPILILGGPSSGDTQSLLADVEGSIQAGGQGVMIGRGIWQTDDPRRVIQAMNAIVHDGVSAIDAW